MYLAEVVERVEVHLQNLVRLPEAVPRSIVAGIDVQRCGARYVFRVEGAVRRAYRAVRRPNRAVRRAYKAIAVLIQH